MRDIFNLAHTYIIYVSCARALCPSHISHRCFIKVFAITWYVTYPVTYVTSLLKIQVDCHCLHSQNLKYSLLATAARFY